MLDVAWYRPPNRPIPFSSNIRNKVCIPSKKQTAKIVIAIRENNIDLSRLKLTALDSSMYKSEVIAIVFIGLEPANLKIFYLLKKLPVFFYIFFFSEPGEKFEFSFLMYEIKVLTY